PPTSPSLFPYTTLFRSLYDEDFYRWTQHQAALLRSGKWQELDYANLAEEVESLGKWDKRDLEQRLEGLLIQLLTWWAKPEDRCRSEEHTSELQSRENLV